MFSFRQRPGITDILFDDDPILTFIQEHLVLRNLCAEGLKLRPHGPVELLSLVPSTFYGRYLLRAGIECEVEGPHGIRVVLIPEKVDEGLADYVRERREIHIVYLPEQDRFRYTFTVHLDFLQDVRGDEGLAMTVMPQWGDDDYAVIEFDDPLLSGGVGPQVPMTQDWVGLLEPQLSEAGFTTAWVKRYLSSTLYTMERGPQKIVFNRVVNGVQQFYNRYVLKTAPKTPFVFEKTDGRYVRYTPLFDYPSGQHICEWGFDIHLYALLPKAAPGVLFAKGQHEVLAYEFEEVERGEVPAHFLNAPDAAIEPEERALADRPIYEEPVCQFTRSTLDCPDNYPWQGEGRCVWNRTGGKEAGTGALEIHHGEQAGESAWDFRYLGPSTGCNPIPPHSRFRVSAWVKADELDKFRLELTLTNFNGPAMYASRTPILSTGAARDIKERDGDYALVEFISTPSGPYTLTGAVTFTYTGKGSASLCSLRVERL